MTGGGHGLGAHIAMQLARRGLSVIVADVNYEAALATAERVGGTAWELDVADLAACRNLVAQADDLVVWCNNAGLLETGPGWELDEGQRRRLFDVNVHGLINGTTAALERMRPARAGHVLNVASLAALTPAPSETLYAATKQAALAFSVGTQLDLFASDEHRVRVSAICPDGMWTPMLHDLARDPRAWPSWSGVMLDPVDVAKATVALLDRPRMVRAMPRRRGVQLRLLAANPDLGARLLPVVRALALRRQRRWADAHEPHPQTTSLTESEPHP